MTEEKTEVLNENQNEESIESLKAELARYKAKHAETEKHRKSAEQKAREMEELQRQSEEEGLKQREEFRTLYERETKAKAELAEKYEGFSKRIQQKEIEGAALQVATELTRDTKRAELLKEQVSKYARYTDDGVKFEMGGIEVERDKVVAHIKDNFPFLVDGSGATGGAAIGNKGSGASKEITREAFDKKAPHEKTNFIREGGKVI